MERLTIYSTDLHCSEESRLIQVAFSGKEGVGNVSCDLLKKEAVVTYDEEVISSEELLKIAQSTGLKVSLDKPEPKSVGKKTQWILCVTSGLLLLIGLILHLTVKIIPFFFLGAIVTGGWYVAPKAFASLRSVRPDMNLLMTIAVIGAIAINQWVEAASVTFLFSVALLLESWSVERARREIESLLDLSPQTARVASDSDWVEKPAEEVNVDEIVFVKPGEKIPLDGIVTKGQSSVNQAPITGESFPIVKEGGDPVYAGTLNQEGGFEFAVTKGAENTTLARIISMVEGAKKRRAASEQWVEKFARIYTPIMMVGALLMALVPPLLLGALWSEWIYRALVLLVIACPCALVISTPVTIVSALASAARSGVLIKGGLFLETVAHLQAIAFDKTGTITEGRPKVQKIVPLNGHTPEELLTIAASLEKPAKHPLATAVLDKASRMGISPPQAEDYEVFPGLGAEGTIDKQRFWIGSHRFMHEAKRNENAEAHNAALELEDAGHSVIAIGDFTHICGLLSVADTVREESSACIQELKDLGIKEVALLTGDNRKTGQLIGEEVGVDTLLAELMPEEKVGALEEIKKRYPYIAMVGDGVNDAPAMAASSIGIAMGGMGTDTAFETADIVLMRDDLAKIPWLIRHGKRALSVVKENITFALLVKAVFILLDFFGLASLWMAIAADTGASLLVVTNGLRLLRRR